MDEQQNGQEPVREESRQPVQSAEQTPSVAPTQMRMSGFWVRGAASIIDGCIVSMVTMPVSFILGFAIGIVSLGASETGAAISDMVAQLIGMVIGLGATWGYHIFMTHKYQATLGKMAVDARVVSENGDKLTLQNIILRETVGKMASALMLGIGYFMVGFTQKKQGLHDMIAKSIVVYNNAHVGPRKWVVGVVYGLYACLIIGFLAMIGLIVGLGIMAASTLDEGDAEQGEGQIEDIFNEYMEEPAGDDQYMMDMTMVEES